MLAKLRSLLEAKKSKSIMLDEILQKKNEIDSGKSTIQIKLCSSSNAILIDVLQILFQIAIAPGTPPIKATNSVNQYANVTAPRPPY